MKKTVLVIGVFVFLFLLFFLSFREGKIKIYVNNIVKNKLDIDVLIEENRICRLQNISNEGFCESDFVNKIKEITFASNVYMIPNYDDIVLQFGFSSNKKYFVYGKGVGSVKSVYKNEWNLFNGDVLYIYDSNLIQIDPYD